MSDEIRYGRYVADLPVELEFGAWGRLETTQALDLFDGAHAYFDQEDVIKAEQARRAVIREAWKYYDGWHASPLKVTPGQRDDNILLNFCRVLVNDSVAWLFGHPETGVLKFAVDAPTVPDAVEDAEIREDGTDTPLEKAIALLERVYTASGGFAFFQRWGMHGTLAGHSFVKLVPRKAPGTATGALLTLDESTPARLVVLDPEQVAVMTDPADTTRPMAFKVEWERTLAENGRKTVYLYRQLVVRTSEEEPEAWVIADFRAKKLKKRTWELVNGPFAWPYAWCPIVDTPNLLHGKNYWGITDLEDVTRVNDAINFSASNTGRILKFHGHPKTIATGVPADGIVPTAVDDLWAVDAPDAKVYNLEMQSDLSAAQNFVDMLRMAFWTIGRGLDLSVFKDRIGQVTNFGLRILAHRALTKNGDKRVLYGQALKQINAHLLEMGGLTGYTTTTTWPDPLPADPQTEVSTQEAERRLGVVSKQTIAEERGRSWEVERARMEEEQKNSMNLGQFLTDQFDRANNPDGDQDGQ